MTDKPTRLGAELTPEQEEALSWLTADFLDWLAETGRLPPAAGDDDAAEPESNEPQSPAYRRGKQYERMG